MKQPLDIANISTTLILIPLKFELGMSYSQLDFQFPTRMQFTSQINNYFWGLVCKPLGQHAQLEYQ